MDGLGPVDLVVSIPTFVGSVLSMTSCAGVLLCYLILPQQKHFRHVLIMNLALADFLNSLNNTVSGMYIMVNPSHKISPGRACDFNAWVGQITVQAVDFSILAISLCLWWTIRQSNVLEHVNTTRRVLICLSIWIMPTITSTSGLILRVYGPVSGNWCWIRPDHVLEQYLLGHGWRLLIMMTTLGIYALVSWKLKRLFKPFDHIPSTVQSTAPQTRPSFECLPLPLSQGLVSVVKPSIVPKNATISVHQEDHGQSVATASSSATGSCTHCPQVTPWPRDNISRQPNVNRMLLLHGYPILYVLLWLPGMANRLVSVVVTPPTWLTALQTSTQFVGFANAVTYGYNENIRRQLRQWWHGRRSYVPT